MCAISEEHLKTFKPFGCPFLLFCCLSALFFCLFVSRGHFGNLPNKTPTQNRNVLLVEAEWDSHAIDLSFELVDAFPHLLDAFLQIPDRDHVFHRQCKR